MTKKAEPVLTTQDYWTPELLESLRNQIINRGPVVEKKKKKGTVEVKPIPSIKDEITYDLNKSNNDFDIVAKVKVDAPGTDMFGHSFEWLPNRSTSTENYSLRANIPVNIHNTRVISLAYRGITNIDCGLSVKLPDRFKLMVALKEEWTTKGLVVLNTSAVKSERVSISVGNIGKEIITIKHGDPIAQMWIMPVYNLILETE